MEFKLGYIIQGLGMPNEIDHVVVLANINITCQKHQESPVILHIIKYVIK